MFDLPLDPSITIKETIAFHEALLASSTPIVEINTLRKKFSAVNPANTAYLLLSELSLARMATILGDHAMAQRRRAKYAKGAAAMRTRMWSRQQGCFLSVHRDTFTQVQLQRSVALCR